MYANLYSKFEAETGRRITEERIIRGLDCKSQDYRLWQKNTI